MNREIKIFILLFGLFLVFYFMPMESVLFTGAIIEGFKMLNEYSREHVLTCLLPAFFIAGAISVFIKKDLILRYLGGKAHKTLAYLIASVSGIILAVCSCTILPLFAGIRKRGAGLGPAITFLYSGPAINIAAIFLTLSVLGFDIGIARIISAVLISVLAGLSMQFIFRENIEEGNLLIDQNASLEYGKTTILLFMSSMIGVLIVNGLQINFIVKLTLIVFLILTVIYIAISQFNKSTNIEWLKETWNFVKMLLPVLFIGVFVAGFVMPFLPSEFIENIVGSNSLISNITASIFGAFMYFSTLTEIPILQALIAKGMHQGPVLSLLLAGPSLSLPNMLVIRRILGNLRTLVYVLIVIAYSTIAGLIFGSLV